MPEDYIMARRAGPQHGEIVLPYISESQLNVSAQSLYENMSLHAPAAEQHVKGSH